MPTSRASSDRVPSMSRVAAARPGSTGLDSSGLTAGRRVTRAGLRPRRDWAALVLPVLTSAGFARTEEDRLCSRGDTLHTRTDTVARVVMNDDGERRRPVPSLSHVQPGERGDGDRHTGSTRGAQGEPAAAWGRRCRCTRWTRARVLADGSCTARGGGPRADRRLPHPRRYRGIDTGRHHACHHPPGRRRRPRPPFGAGTCAIPSRSSASRTPTQRITWDGESPWAVHSGNTRPQRPLQQDTSGS